MSYNVLRTWRGASPDRVVPSINSVCLAIFALTMIPLYHSFYDIHPFPHTVFSVEVSPCVDLGKLGATPLT